MFLGIGSALRVVNTVGIGFSAVDGCHMKHVHYRDGIAHICITLDGNNRVILLVLTLCESESILRHGNGLRISVHARDRDVLATWLWCDRARD